MMILMNPIKIILLQDVMVLLENILAALTIVVESASHLLERHVCWDLGTLQGTERPVLLILFLDENLFDSLKEGSGDHHWNVLIIIVVD